MAFTMTLTVFVQRAYMAATGKATPPESGNAKYAKIVALANQYQQEWASEPGVDWNSLRSTFDIGTISATDTFDLDTDIGKLSLQEGDFVRVTHTDGGETDYTIVPVSKLQNYGSSVCAVSGPSLLFPEAFTATSPQFGGTITVPGFVIPDDLVSARDTVQVDDPQWLVYMVAAEYVRTDLTRQDQRPGLIEMATERMQGMKERNGAQREEVYTDWSPLGSTWC